MTLHRFSCDLAEITEIRINSLTWPPGVNILIGRVQTRYIAADHSVGSCEANNLLLVMPKQ